ncbi:hypothetical protein [Streptomyces sp. NPDC002889]|uniref:hypothetical protein n=1 Tax=Streptomyces sp. NPDC002889 TaxID=3364669 RepID=UPI0036758E56
MAFTRTFPQRRGLPVSVTPYRRPAVAAGAALLALAITGCSGLGRTAVGPLTFETGRKHHVTLNSPPVGGCDSPGPDGAVAVENETEVDVILYPTADCSGDESIYVPSGMSDVVAPGAGPWRSYSFVH